MDVPYKQMALCTTESWIKSVWAICAEYQISMHDSFGTFALSRDHDEFLMPLFAKFIQDPAILATLNECRMFLKALTLADICTMDGRHIFAIGIHWPETTTSTALFQLAPTTSSIAENPLEHVATKLMELFIQVGSRELLLNKPLGKWLIDPTKHWTWFLEPMEGTIYELNKTLDYEVYIPSVPHRSRARGTAYHHHHTTAERPTSAVPCTVMPKTKDQVILLGATSHTLPQLTKPEIPPPTTLKQAYEQLNPLDQWAAPNVTCEDNGHSLAELIKKGKVIAVSDGSSGEDIATSSFVITSHKKRDEANTKPAQGSNTAPGTPDDQNSYRGEVAGIAGVVATTKMICNVHDITEGSLEIGLDGDSAMKVVFREKNPKPEDPCCDMILDIRRKIRELPIRVTGRHIEGHQDKHKSLHQLDRWAKLNVQMDTIAKDLLRERIAQGHISQPAHLGNETLQVYFRGNKLSRVDKTKLDETIYGEKLFQVWQERHNLTHDHVDKINWTAIGKALHAEPLGKRRFLCKHLSGMNAVGKQLLRRKWQDHSKCPLCDAEHEDGHHILTCKDDRAHNTWMDAMDALEIWLTNERTNSHLTAVIISRLNTWRTGSNPQLVQGPKKLRKLISEQDSIGWENFLFGRVTSSMATYQQQHFDNIKSQRHGSAWLSKTIRQLWLIMWKMWNHRNKASKAALTPQLQSKLKNLRLIIRQEFAAGKTVCCQKTSTSSIQTHEKPR